MSFKTYGVTIAVLLISLSFTFLAWRYSISTIGRQMETQFYQEIKETEDTIGNHLDEYIIALYGLQSLFATDEGVTRSRWQAYCENLSLKSRIAGVQFLAFYRRVPQSELRRFTQAANDDRLAHTVANSDHNVFPQTNANTVEAPQTEAFVTQYIWPREENRNLDELGVNTDSINRQLVERATDFGMPVASARIQLPVDKEHGAPNFIIYLPVYDFGKPVLAVDDRRRSVKGVVAAAFRANDLITRILNRMMRHPHIDLEIFDGAEISRESLYYNDDEVVHAFDSDYKPKYQKVTQLNVYGQPWTLHFCTLPEFGLGDLQESLPAVVLSAGVIFSLLLSGIVFSLSSSRMRAIRIAERKSRELEKQRALSMRSDRLRSLGEMAAGIAHELYQPLVGVRGLAEHILIGRDRGWKLDEQTIRKKISMVVEQADRMAHIIEHVRIFAREAGKPEIRQVNVNEVVESTLSLLNAQLRSRGFSLEKRLVTRPPLVLANPFSLEEVVLNLLVNARDALEEKIKAFPDMKNPQISIHTRREREDRRPFVIIEVVDNGVGIPEEIEGRIFDPFFTTKGPDKGTGLGLSISKTIVEDFGGTLYFESRQGEKSGTTATIVLPAIG